MESKRLLIPLVFGVLMSCRPAPWVVPVIHMLAISDAMTLFVATDSNEMATLYKVTTSGAVQRVPMYDDAGEEVGEEMQHPIDLAPSTSGFFLVSLKPFTSWATGTAEYTYLVRGSDGLAIDVSELGTPPASYLPDNLSFSPLQSDANGRLYLHLTEPQVYPGRSRVLRLNAATIDPALASECSCSTDEARRFLVDSDGNVAYVGSIADSSAGASEVARIYTTTGGYKVLQSIYSYSPMWKAPDGHIYVYGEGGIRRIEVTPTSDVVFTTYGSTTFSGYLGVGSRSASVGGRCILVSGGSYPAEVYNPAGEPRSLEYLPRYGSIYSFEASTSFYYLLATDESNVRHLWKLEPDTYTQTDLLAGHPGYDPLLMCVSSNGTVTLSAIRLTDGKRILAQIDASGGFHLLDGLNNLNVRSLVTIR